jgi:hypothetical protein
MIQIKHPPQDAPVTSSQTTARPSSGGPRTRFALLLLHGTLDSHRAELLDIIPSRCSENGGDRRPER